MVDNHFVSVIIPCRNEENYIDSIIQNINEQDYPKKNLEVIFIDGMSDDNTIDIIKKHSLDFPNFILVSNIKKTVPFALNLGIKKSKGDVILRMDAHSIYPKNYISRLVSELFRLDADNTGGIWIIYPPNDKPIARCIAVSQSCKFGIGNANYRFDNKLVKEVDTVPYGCYKRSVFDKIGYFDEELTRNQDDEFNSRLKKNGGKIYLIPDVKIIYYSRESIKKLSKMFFQYGFFKPLVSKKTGAPSSLRQLIPPAFVFFLLLSPILIINSELSIIFFSILILYFVISLFYTVHFIVREKKIYYIFLPYIFLSIHLSYGVGYLWGLFYFFILNKNIKEVSISR